jgi:hypothetical protein
MSLVRAETCKTIQQEALLASNAFEWKSGHLAGVARLEPSVILSPAAHSHSEEDEETQSLELLPGHLPSLSKPALCIQPQSPGGIWLNFEVSTSN